MSLLTARAGGCGSVAYRGIGAVAGPSLTCVPVRITRSGGPEVMDVVDLPDPVPGDGEQPFDISSSRVNVADTHHRLSAD